MAGVELRQLRYFVAVAEELNFGRAAERLLIAGPSLSQQIKVLERDLGVRLFDRDRRSVRLTPTGSALLPHVRDLLDRARDVERRAAQLAGYESVRLGYVNWLPPDVVARTSHVARLHVDAWVVPSHAQAARVAEGGLDLAICWVREQDLERHGLRARLVGVDRLYAVSTGGDTSEVAARDTAVLIDDDTVSWSSWNDYAGRLARDVGAHVVRIDDGGVTGPAFFDHVRRSSRPVVNSPKGQAAPLPPDLVQRPVAGPALYWTWSLVWRRGETSAAVLAVVEALTGSGPGAVPGQADGDGWLPDGDPYKAG
ncbi:LysR family transcriptional regulator [Streptomyces sp. NBC_01497]|uniref:LysR family transcriptional regulator n=1 Tax=Streptomyces sp. NBC_01497 TaxID=2903885 RepID=UPI002E34AE5A|nr:LysR family transcriptional regulator [Streptomyces sp. NBC_01497]